MPIFAKTSETVRVPAVWTLAAALLVALVLVQGLGGPAWAGGKRIQPPLQIFKPAQGANLSSTSNVRVVVRYNGQAMPVQNGSVALQIRVNSQFVTILPSDVDATVTSLAVPATDLHPGRNVVTAFLPSSNPDASLNNGYLVRHRVFFIQDQDKDGIPDAAEPAGGMTNTDTDADGLLDSVEAHTELGAAAGIPGTSLDGHIQVTSVEPDPVVPGRAAVLSGTGLEAIEQPFEVLFNGLAASAVLAPAPLPLPPPGLVAQQGGSPTSLVVQVPAGLSGPSSANLVLTDNAGTSTGSSIVTVHSEATPPSVGQNLVMVSSILAQQFLDINQLFRPELAPNALFFRNMLPFAAASNVLIDASLIDPLGQPNVTPDLETMYRIQGGVANVSTRLSGSLSSSVLQGIDLLVLLISHPVPGADYSSNARSAIATWLRHPNHRLVVVSDNCCNNESNYIANKVLQDVGATSRFDVLFPTRAGQSTVDSIARVEPVYVDPPFTTGVSRLYYRTPGSILVGPGAHVASEIGTCLSGQTPLTQPDPMDPMHDFLHWCLDANEQQIPLLMANYAVTEQVPTEIPSLVITRVSPGGALDPATAVSVPTNGLAEIAPATQAAVEARPMGFTASAVTAKLGAQSFPMALDPATGLYSTAVPFDPTGPGLGLRVEATAPGVSVGSSVVVRAKRQRVKLNLVTFSDASGMRALDPGVLQKSLRQSGVELAALCSPENGVQVADANGVPLPPLDPTLRVESGTVVQHMAVNPDDDAFALLLYKVDGMLTPQAINLARGTLPDGNNPNNVIPDPAPGDGTPSPVRVFIVGKFRRRIIDSGGNPQTVDISQDTEAGISQFGQAFGGSDTAGQDAVILQASAMDLEAGTLKVARPVASSLSHELLHVIAAIDDNADEIAGSNGQPVDLPTPTTPSMMNSFPFFRALTLGGATVKDSCDASVTFPTGQAGLDRSCKRVLAPFSCATRSFDFTE